MSKKKGINFDEDEEKTSTPAVVNTDQHIFKFDLNKITKTNIEKASSSIVQSVENGDVDPIKEFMKAKAMNEVSGQMLDKLKPHVINEMKGARSYEAYGLKLEITNGRKEYDFSDSPEWQRLKSKADAATAELKNYEDLMKKAMDFGGVADKEGVEVVPAKIKSYGSDVLKTNIPK